MSPASSQSMSRSFRPRTPPLSLMDEIVAWADFVTGLTTYFDIGELTLLIDPSRISLPVTPVSLLPRAPPGAGAGAPGFGVGAPGAGAAVPPWPVEPSAMSPVKRWRLPRLNMPPSLRIVCIGVLARRDDALRPGAVFPHSPGAASLFQGSLGDR